MRVQRCWHYVPTVETLGNVTTDNFVGSKTPSNKKILKTNTQCHYFKVKIKPKIAQSYYEGNDDTDLEENNAETAIKVHNTSSKVIPYIRDIRANINERDSSYSIK